MLRIIGQSVLRLAKPSFHLRCFAMEPTKCLEDLDREKKIKIFELEISMLEQDGRKAPSIENITQNEWDRILALPSKTARKRFYEFLWTIEMKNASRERKKEERRAANEERLKLEREERAQNDHLNYGLIQNTIFLRIYDSTIMKFHNNKLIRAMQFEQKLVIDCSYDEYMTQMEASNTGKQLMLSFADNRSHDEPFDLHFCNLDPRSTQGKTLNRFIPTLYDKEFPINVTRESMTAMFDKSKLVYLTPHCNNDLVKFDHDDIYIIGAMVDKTNHEPLSLAKAKKQGLRMARLPLDRYMDWGAGSGKSLTINQMVNILLEMKKSGDWEKALRFVPRRKLADYSQRERNPEISRENKPRSFTSNRQPREENNNSYRNQWNTDRQMYRPDRRFPEQNFNSNQRHSPNRSFDNRQRKFNIRDEIDFHEEDSHPSDRKKSSENKSHERKHFERFQFDLNTWGRKTKKSSTES